MSTTLSLRLLLIAALATLPGCFLFGDEDDTAGDDTLTMCDTADECPTGQVCAADRCVDEGSIGLGGNCSANRDCGTALFCSPNGVCAPSGTGGEGDACTSGADCTKDLVCELYGFGGTCVASGTGDVGEACTASADCLAGLSCGVDGTCDRTVDAYPPFTGVTCPADAAPFKAFFQVPRATAPLSDFFRLPFPNDARVNADGTLNMTDFPRPGPSILGVDLIDLYADALSEDFDGFSTVANVTFRFSKELDFDTIGTNGANIHFIDITDPLGPDFGDDRNRAFSYDPGENLYECQHTLQIAPQRHDPLVPGHKYAVYINNMIRSAIGEAPAQDSDLGAMLSDTAPTDTALTAAWNAYANFRAWMSTSGVTAAEIAGLTVFTVQDPNAKALALATEVLAGPLPTLSSLTLCDGSTPSPCEIAGDTERVCGDSSGSFWEIHGRMSVPNFQQGILPYDFPQMGGQIDYVSGVPQQNGTLDVCFALTVPKTAAPGGGYPLVVHAHGTGGSFKAAIDNGISEHLAIASTPMATLTFDGVAHGERRGASTRDSDGLVFNVVNPRAARDNHLQGAVDVMQALRVAQVASFDVGTVTGIDFDASKTYYFGHSQGSNVGILGVAVTDLAPAAVFSGAGSYLSEGILSKTSPVNAADGLAAVVGEPIGNGHPMMTIWQTFFDRIDPVNYDPLLIARPPSGLASKHVFMTWGAGDTYSPETTMNITAKAMKLNLAPPIVTQVSGLTSTPRPISQNRAGGDGVDRTAVCGQYQSDGTFDGHFVSTRVQAAIDDWTDFLVSAAETGIPTLP